jgi:hypothetical protein
MKVITLTDSTLNVERMTSFSIGYSGASGEVTASVSLLNEAKVDDLTVNSGDNGSGTVTGTLTAAAASGNTIVLTITDTYLDEEVEITDNATCEITVVTDGIQPDLDQGTDGDTVFGRQQALCDNQVIIANKVNTVRNLIITSLVGQVAQLATSIGLLTATLSELKSLVKQLQDDLPNIVQENGKTTVNYGD